MNARNTERARRSTIDVTPFQQIGLDSGALGRLGAVIHRFAEPGHYSGYAVSDGNAAGKYSIVVDAGAAPNAEVDLSAVSAAGAGASGGDDDCGCAGKPGGSAATVSVAPGGVVTFYVGSGSRTWSTVVNRADGGVEFDSQRLECGDLFAATILRPGQYSMRNAHGKASTALAVRYVRPGKEPFVPGDPCRLKMSDKASRASVRLAPAQGLVVEAMKTTRVVIKLSEADDGPKRR